MLILTSLCANYLPKARVLAESVKRHSRNRVWVCLVEKTAPPELTSREPWDGLVLAKDLGISNFGRFIAGRSRLEAATAVKAQWFLHALARFPHEKDFLFLDPDMTVYTDFRPLQRLLRRHPLIVTPHLLTPHNLEMEVSALNHGAYNLGFLALRRGPRSGAFLAWWRERLQFACYDDRPHGLFTDQKWADLVPSLFDAHVLRDPGYNVATWNLGERRLTPVAGGLAANGRPLQCLHFSGFDQGTFRWAAERWGGRSRLRLRALAGAYARALARHGQKDLGNRPWSYDRLDDGRLLPLGLRAALRRPEVLPGEDPYALSLRELRRRLPWSASWPGRAVRGLRRAAGVFLRELGGRRGRGF